MTKTRPPTMPKGIVLATAEVNSMPYFLEIKKSEEEKAAGKLENKPPHRGPISFPNKTEMAMITPAKIALKINSFFDKCLLSIF